MSKEARKKKRKRRIWWFLGGGVLLIVILMMASGGGEKTIRITTENSDLRDITETVSANGKIQPEVNVKISPDVSGEIVELAVKEGDKVEKGDLLVKINPDVYESTLNRVEASLNNAKAQLANAKAQLARVKARFKSAESNFKRQKKLHEKGAISEAEFEKALSDYESAKADVEASKETVKASRFSVASSKASVKEAKDQLEKTTIYAPRSGTISALQVEEGERVVGTAQMAGTEMMNVADLSEMEVNVEVNENDIVRVEMGDTATVEVDAYLEKDFKGIVTEIANAASTSGQGMDQVTNFPVKIRILRSSYTNMVEDTTNSPFRPGMSATVDIKTRTVNDVVSVPIRAVSTRKDTAGSKKEDQELKECLFLYEEEKAFLRFVKTGIQDDEFIEIKEGLEKGKEVITGPYDAVSKELKDSTKVKKVSEEMLFNKEES